MFDAQCVRLGSLPMTQVTQMTQDWSMGDLFARVRFRFTEDGNDAGFLMVGSRSVRLGSFPMTR